MTDNEIIKALECCTKGLECKNCPANPHKGNYGYCTGLLLKDTLDLINRQKANLDDKEDTIQYADKVIKSLQADMDKLQANVSELVKQTKAEAYKECIEEVKTIICDNTYPDFDKKGKAVCIWKPEAYKNIDNLLKETVGDTDES